MATKRKKETPVKVDVVPAKILVQRRDCLGDVLVGTSVLPGLRQKYPNATIDFLATQGYHVPLLNNPYLNSIVHDADPTQYDLHIVLDHHRQWDMTMAACHCRDAGVPFHAPELYFTEEEEKFGAEHKGCIAWASHAGWANRRYAHWDRVIPALVSFGFDIVAVDLNRRLPTGVRKGNLSLREAFAVIKYSSLYLGVDTVFMHAASACCVPQVVIMGATGVEIQYIPCSTILRPKPFVEMAFMGAELIDVPSADVIAAVLASLDNGEVVIQHTDNEGRVHGD